MTTTEEEIRLARKMADTVCDEIGPVVMCKDPLSFAQEVAIRISNHVRAEENESCAKLCESHYNHEAKDCAEEIRERMK